MADARASLLLAVEAQTAQAKQALGQLGTSVKTLDGQMGRAATGGTKFGTAIRTGAASAVTGLKALGTSFGAVAGAAGVGLLVKNSIKAFSDMERGMNEVFTLLPGISGAAMDQMTAQVQDLSRELAIPTRETIPALYQALSAGIPADNVFSFMEVAGKTAIGGVTDLSTAVDGLSTIVNAWGLSADEAMRASDALFTAMRLGKTTVGELSQSIGTVAPLAAELGVSFEEVLAATATLTKQGQETSVAMTGIRAALVAVIRPTSEMQQAVEALGFSSGRAMVEALGFQGAMEALARYSAETGTEMVTLTGRVEGAQTALALTGESAAGAASDLDALQNSAGATEQAFETMNQGMSRDLDRLKVAWDSMLQGIGKALSTLAPVLSAIGTAFSVVGDVFIEWGNLIDQYVLGPLGDVADVVGTALSPLADLVGQFDTSGRAARQMAEALQEVADRAGPLSQQQLRELIAQFTKWGLRTGDLEGALRDLADAAGVPFELVARAIPDVVEMASSLGLSEEAARKLAGALREMELQERRADLKAYQEEAGTVARWNEMNAETTRYWGRELTDLSGQVLALTGDLEKFTAVDMTELSRSVAQAARDVERELVDNLSHLPDDLADIIADAGRAMVREWDAAGSAMTGAVEAWEGTLDQALSNMFADLAQRRELDKLINAWRAQGMHGIAGLAKDWGTEMLQVVRELADNPALARALDGFLTDPTEDEIDRLLELIRQHDGDVAAALAEMMAAAVNGVDAIGLGGQLGANIVAGITSGLRGAGGASAGVTEAAAAAGARAAHGYQNAFVAAIEREFGGQVFGQAMTRYLVGEVGPEIFVPFEELLTQGFSDAFDRSAVALGQIIGASGEIHRSFEQSGVVFRTAILDAFKSSVRQIRHGDIRGAFDSLAFAAADIMRTMGIDVGDAFAVSLQETISRHIESVDFDPEPAVARFGDEWTGMMSSLDFTTAAKNMVANLEQAIQFDSILERLAEFTPLLAAQLEEAGPEWASAAATLVAAFEQGITTEGTRWATAVEQALAQTTPSFSDWLADLEQAVADSNAFRDGLTVLMDNGLVYLANRIRDMGPEALPLLEQALADLAAGGTEAFRANLLLAEAFGVAITEVTQTLAGATGPLADQLRFIAGTLGQGFLDSWAEALGYANFDAMLEALAAARPDLITLASESGTEAATAATDGWGQTLANGFVWEPAIVAMNEGAPAVVEAAAAPAEQAATTATDSWGQTLANGFVWEPAIVAMNEGQGVVTETAGTAAETAGTTATEAWGLATGAMDWQQATESITADTVRLFESVNHVFVTMTSFIAAHWETITAILDWTPTLARLTEQHALLAESINLTLTTIRDQTRLLWDEIALTMDWATTIARLTEQGALLVEAINAVFDTIRAWVAEQWAAIALIPDWTEVTTRMVEQLAVLAETITTAFTTLRDGLAVLWDEIELIPDWSETQARLAEQQAAMTEQVVAGFTVMGEQVVTAFTTMAQGVNTAWSEMMATLAQQGAELTAQVTTTMTNASAQALTAWETGTAPTSWSQAINGLTGSAPALIAAATTQATNAATSALNAWDTGTSRINWARASAGLAATMGQFVSTAQAGAQAAVNAARSTWDSWSPSAKSATFTITTVHRTVYQSVGAPGRQHGGPVIAGQPYVVGEKRPEVFVPNTSGYIVPRTDSPRLGGGRAATVVVNVEGNVITERELSETIRAELVKLQRRNLTTGLT